MEHTFQEKKAPPLYVGGTPVQMFSSYLIQKQLGSGWLPGLSSQSAGQISFAHCPSMENSHSAE